MIEGAGYVKRGAGLLVVFSLLLGGCSSIGVDGSGSSVDRKEAVAKIASDRWALLLQGKLDDAYRIYFSEASKALISIDGYRGSIKPGLWKGAKVSDVDCAAEDLCTVNVVVKYAYRGRGGVVVENETVISELWRKLGDGWKFVHKP